MRAGCGFPAAAAVLLLAAVALAAAEDEQPMLLLVQTGRAVEVTQEDGELYTIKITGASPKTLVFTNRPAHRADLSPTDRVIASLNMTEADPVNAALVYPQDGGDVAALVELTSGSFDAATGLLSYTARPLPLEHDFGDATNHNKTELEVTSASGGVALLLDEPTCPARLTWCAVCGQCMLPGCTVMSCFSGGSPASAPEPDLP